MKALWKILLSVVIVSTLALCFVACGGSNEDKGDNNQGNNPSAGGESANMIFNSQSEVQIVLGNEVTEETRTDIFDSLYPILLKTPKVTDDTAAKAKHEIVIGECDRDISREAYRLLARKEDEMTRDGVGYLIYSDGSSVCIAFYEDKYGLSMAADLAIEKLLSYVDTDYVLALAPGTVDYFVFDPYEYQKALDQKVLDE